MSSQNWFGNLPYILFSYSKDELTLCCHESWAESGKFFRYDIWDSSPCSNSDKFSLSLFLSLSFDLRILAGWWSDNLCSNSLALFEILMQIMWNYRVERYFSSIWWQNLCFFRSCLVEWHKVSKIWVRKGIKVPHNGWLEQRVQKRSHWTK